MKKQRRLKIKMSRIDQLLLILAPVIGITVFALILVSLNRYKYNQRNSTYEIINGLAKNQEEQLTEYIDGKVTVLKALAGFSEIYEMDRVTFYRFIQEKGSDFGFTGLFIVDTAGTGYYPEESVMKDQSGEEFFRLISEHDTYVTDPFYTASGPIATICQAIYNPDGERVGTLCGKITLENIQDLVNRNETLMGGHCFILNAGGYYISSTDLASINQQTSAYDYEGNSLDLIKRAFENQADEMGTITIDSEEYFASVKYVENFDWAVVMCVPVSSVESSYRNIVILQNILAAMMLILCICVIHMVRCWIRSDRDMCTDALCKCGSRAASLKMMEELDKSNKDVAVLYADLNHFKLINDNYGHEVGDKALKLFSSVLMDVYGRYGFVGRMGGDEFIVLLEDCTAEQTEKLWQEVAMRLASDHESLPDGIVLSCAHGVVLREATSSMSLSKASMAADQTMYQDKTLCHNSDK